MWPVWSWDFKTDCISKMNIWNKLIFCMLVQIQKSWKLIQRLLGGHCQKCPWFDFWMLIVMQLFLVRLVSCSMTFNYRGEGVGSTAVARLVWAEIRSPPTPWLLDMGGPLQLYFLFEGRLDLPNLAKCEIFLRLRG